MALILILVFKKIMSANDKLVSFFAKFILYCKVTYSILKILSTIITIWIIYNRHMSYTLIDNYFIIPQNLLYLQIKKIRVYEDLIIANIRNRESVFPFFNNMLLML